MPQQQKKCRFCRMSLEEIIEQIKAMTGGEYYLESVRDCMMEKDETELDILKAHIGHEHPDEYKKLMLAGIIEE